MNLKNRLDIIVKYLFIKSYEENNNFNYYKELYIKHIKIRTGGIEDNKKSYNDFVDSFIDLISSFKKNNFDSKYPIPINSDNEILNGAHRIACCLYFDIEPIYKEDNISKGIIWDYKWFEKNEFRKTELIDILLGYTEINKDFTIVILWPTILEKKEIIKKEIEKNHNIIGNINLDLESKEVFKELIYDIYSIDGNIQHTLLTEEKANILSQKGTNIEILLIDNKSEKFKKNKEKIRKKFSFFTGIKNLEKSKYYTFHSSDNTLEALYLSEIILDKNNLKYLKLRNLSQNSIFINRLEKLEKYLEKNNINKKDICLVGSTALEIFNLNKSSDIDFIKKIHKNNGIIKISKDIDLLDYQYYKKVLNKDIINNHYFYFRGFKFISLTLLKEIKIIGNRSKDLKQAKIIEDFLKNNLIKKRDYFYKIKIQFLFIKRKILINLLNYTIFITKKIGIYKQISYLWRKLILKKILINNKNILIISNNYYPYPFSGGVVKQVELLSKNFIKKGYKVNILTRKFNKDIITKEKIYGANIYRYKNFYYFIKFLIKNSDKYKIIISRQYYRKSLFLSILKYLNIIQTKTIICADSGGDNDEINKIKNKIKFKILYKIYFFLIGQNDILNCLNKYNKDHLENIYNGKSKYLERIRNIYNGIDISSFEKKEIKNVKNILFLGRLEKEKGIYETIKAFKLINNQNIKLNIVGFGNNNIEKRIKMMIKNDNRIEFLSKKIGKEKEIIIQKTDLFLLPSYSEGQSVTITEMVLKNIPIISTDVANNKDIYGNNIIYVEKENIEDLKNKIEWIIKNISKFKYNYENILKKIDINNTTDSFINK